MRPFLVLFAVLLMLAGSAAVAQPPDKKDLPKPLPDAVVKAWRDAGARVAWWKGVEYGILDKPNVGAVPLFLFNEWNDGVVAKLPAPDTAFGLALEGVTDAGLKELAHLNNLTLLVLSGTKVTDAGLKELAPLRTSPHYT